MKILVSEQADADLLEFFTYLAERNSSAAEAVATELDNKFQQLLRFPFAGRERPMLAPGLRSIVAGRYVIFYLAGSDQVTIVRVLDGRRDIDSEFQQ